MRRGSLRRSKPTSRRSAGVRGAARACKNRCCSAGAKLPMLEPTNSTALASGRAASSVRGRPVLGGQRLGAQARQLLAQASHQPRQRRGRNINRHVLHAGPGGQQLAQQQLGFEAVARAQFHYCQCESAAAPAASACPMAAPCR
ncbi:hypothetical protein MRB53_041974 [Persea americana]|nr:hypothetical protein MRB53_041974 [Persea americana]